MSDEKQVSYFNIVPGLGDPTSTQVNTVEQSRPFDKGDPRSKAPVIAKGPDVLGQLRTSDKKRDMVATGEWSAPTADPRNPQASAPHNTAPDPILNTRRVRLPSGMRPEQSSLAQKFLYAGVNALGVTPLTAAFETLGMYPEALMSGDAQKQIEFSGNFLLNIGAPTAGIQMAKTALAGNIDNTVHSIFGGRPLDQTKVTEASRLLAMGHSPEQVWRQTRVWEYQPGVWLTEIPDANLQLSLTAQSYLGVDEVAMRAEDAFGHNDFYKQYPEARDLEVVLVPAAPGELPEAYFDVDQIVIKTNDPEQAKSLFVHELQHYVAYKENLPLGSAQTYPGLLKDAQVALDNRINQLNNATNLSPELMLQRDNLTRYNKMLTNMSAATKSGQIDPEEFNYFLYYLNKGEVLARLAQDRRLLNDFGSEITTPMWPSDKPFELPKGYSHMTSESVHPLAQLMNDSSSPFASKVDELSQRLNQINDVLAKREGPYKDRIRLMEEKRQVQDQLLEAIKAPKRMSLPPKGPNSTEVPNYEAPTQATELDVRRAQAKAVNDNSVMTHEVMDEVMPWPDDQIKDYLQEADPQLYQAIMREERLMEDEVGHFFDVMYPKEGDLFRINGMRKGGMETKDFYYILEAAQLEGRDGINGLARQLSLQEPGPKKNALMLFISDVIDTYTKEGYW